MHRIFKKIAFIIILITLSLFLFFTLNKVSESNPNKQLEKSMTLYGDWFLRNQTEEGDFNYEIDVKTGEILNSNNIVRQAGSLYSLVHAYKYTKGKEYKIGIEKGIKYFSNLLENVENIVPTKRINYEGKISSNTTALFLLALTEYMEENTTARSEYMNLSKELANYLLLTQNDMGGFSYNLGKSEESDYNNGESFYALIRAYKINNDPIYLEGAKKAADYIISKYSKEKFNYSLYSWAMQGMAHLYKVDPDERYWDFMKFYSNRFLFGYGKNTYSYFTDQKGNPPKSNLGVYLEGLNHVAWVARNKDTTYYEALKDFIQMSLKYLMTLQINGPGSDRKSNIEIVSGGICYDQSCVTQRIDIVHHNLSAIYLYLNYTK